MTKIQTHKGYRIGQTIRVSYYNAIRDRDEIETGVIVEFKRGARGSIRIVYRDDEGFLRSTFADKVVAA